MVEIHNKKLCESCFSETESGICPYCGFSRNKYNADPSVLPVGTMLNDKILIGRVMGKGGFGITYLGYDVRMEKLIAVKEYYPNGIVYRSHTGTDVIAADEKSAEAFENGAEKFYSEAEMVTQFNGNPNIVSVYDYFRANNTVYLVMEYLVGITLKKYVRNHGKISDGQALFIMDKIAAALSITHSAGVLHRDISPDNIMICMDGRIKLIDFGAARQIMAESSSNLTVVMKPGYTPIEQYTKKGRQGAWTDIYALGASVYYALTGVVIDDPYNRMDSDEEFSENRHRINSDLWNIIRKCTMIQADQRYGNAIELRKALSAVTAPVKPEPVVLESSADICTGEDPPADAYESRSEKSPVRKRMMTVLICTAAVILIGVAGIVIAANRPDNIAADDYEDPVNRPDNIAADNYEDPVIRQENTSAYTESPANDQNNITDASETSADDQNNITDTSETSADDQNNITDTSEIFADHQNNFTDASETSGQVSGSDEAAYMLIDENDVQWAAARNISVSALRKFEGDILVALNIQTNNDVENEDGSFWHFISVVDDNNNKVKIDAFNWAENPEGYYVHDGQKQFTFLLPESAVSEIYQYIGFEAYGLTVNSVELRAYSGSDAKIIPFDGQYPGDWHLHDSAIPKTDLESFGGDVMVTLGIETIYDYEEWPWHINIMTDDGEWLNADVSVFNLPQPEHGYMYPVHDGQDKFVFVISRETIEDLPNRGLKVQVHNVVVKEALIEPSEITVKG